jgi:hypothetical protein
MDMTDNDKILKDFFASNVTDVADNGFTERVMGRIRLESSPVIANRVWTAVWSVIALVYILMSDCIPMFCAIILKGIKYVEILLPDMPTAPQLIHSINLSTIVIAVIGVIAIDVVLSKKFLKLAL